MQMMTRVERKGIDISKWQVGVDWDKAKADGVDFAMIRVGIGANNSTPKIDVRFSAHISGAIKANVPVGIYLYSYAQTVQKAKIEADHVINWLKPYKDKIVYPVAFDIEDKTQGGLGRGVLSDMCSAFCEAVKAHGYIPAIYTSSHWAKNLINAAVLSKYSLWLAQWNSKITYPGVVDIWQYTDKGKVKGIAGYVDMNMCYRDFTD